MRVPVVGYEGIYEVSPDGVVCRLASERSQVGRWKPVVRRYPEQVMKVGLNSYGYPVVGLTKDGQQTPKSIHRILAEAFIPNPEGLPQVNHKDGIKTNYSLDNLEWVTVQENLLHRTRVLGMRGLSGEACPWAKLTIEQVRIIRTSERSARSLALEFGVSRALASAIRRGEKWVNHG